MSRYTDPYLAELQEKVNKGEMTEEEQAELIVKYCIEKGICC